MTKLKLGVIDDDKLVKLTIELSAAVYRNLVACTEALSRQTGQKLEPARLISPMLARFMSTDRAFARIQRDNQAAGQPRRIPVARAETPS